MLRFALILLALIFSPLAASADEDVAGQKAAVRYISEPRVLIGHCSSVSLNQDALETVLAEHGLSESDMAEGGRFHRLATGIARDTESLFGTPEENVICAFAMQLYGPEGTSYAGLLERSELSKDQVDAIADFTMALMIARRCSRLEFSALLGKALLESEGVGGDARESLRDSEMRKTFGWFAGILKGENEQEICAMGEKYYGPNGAHRKNLLFSAR